MMLLRQTSIAHFALALALLAAPALPADEVSRAVDRMGWPEVFLEACDPDEADVRLKVSIRSNDLKKQLVELAVRGSRLTPEEKAMDAVFMAPVVLAEAATEEGPRYIVELLNPTRRTFELRIQVREGGPEVLKPTFEESFTGRWTRLQELESEELKVTVTMVVGPRRERFKPSRSTSSAYEPKPAEEKTSDFSLPQTSGLLNGRAARECDTT